MAGTHWTRDELRAFVGDGIVYVRADNTVALPVPAWLAPPERQSTTTAQQSVDNTHPDDRLTLVDSFLTALARPGEVCEAQVRYRRDGTWCRWRVRWLNQVDNPEVNGLIATAEAVDGPPIDAALADDDGHSTPTNWVIVVMDLEGVITACRGTSLAMLGYEPAEMVGHRTSEYIHPDNMTSAVSNWIALLENPGETRFSRQRWLKRDGQEIWVELTHLHDPVSSTVECVIVDVTERIA